MKVMYLCNTASCLCPNILSLLSQFSQYSMCLKLPEYILPSNAVSLSWGVDREGCFSSTWGDSGLMKLGAGRDVCLATTHLTQALFWIPEDDSRRMALRSAPD